MKEAILRNTFKIEEDVEKNTEIYMDCDGLWNGEVHTIAMKAILGDFGPEELADAVDIAEILYEKYNKPVILCLGMDKMHEVTVPEMSIKSEADFTIKLACIDMYGISLAGIRERIANGTADDADRQMLEVIPMHVPYDRRKEVRKECFRLLAQL